MSKHKYRITVEAIGEVDEAEREKMKPITAAGGGIECDGFVIIGDTERKTCVSVVGMSDVGIASAMAEEPTLACAAYIAGAVCEARTEQRNREAKKEMAAELKSRVESLKDLMKI